MIKLDEAYRLDVCYTETANGNVEIKKFVARPSAKFLRLKDNVLNSLKTLSKGYEEQRAVVALLREEVPHCFGSELFQTQLTLLKGYKARRLEEIKMLKQIKFIENYGMSVATVIADNLFDEYEKSITKDFGHAQREFRGRLQTVQAGLENCI